MCLQDSCSLKMISLDHYIIEFVSGNWFTLTLVLGLFKGMAKISKNTHDDAIVTMLSNFVNGIKKG